MKKIVIMKSSISLVLALLLFSCVQESTDSGESEIGKNETPGEYRFERAYGETPDGYPLPLTGKPITKQSVIVKNEEGSIIEYPEYFTPGEALGSEEMRITCMGSGNPPVRMRQAATSWLVQLGNGENFIFDVGGGSVLNLWSMGIPMAELDKLFVTHTHLDHVGGILPLYDAMGWARNTPLRVWGASGYDETLGISAFCKNIEEVANWHNTSKKGIVSSGGMRIEANEFDFSKFSKENPRQLVYDTNGVKIYAFPVDHILEGAVGYRLEWNGLSFVYTGDSVPTSFEAEQSKGVDVFAHEMFIDAPTFAEKNSMPLQVAENIVSEHTPPSKLGEIFSIAQPNLGVGTHYFTNDDTIDPAFQGLRSTYDGPVIIGQDLLVINVTKDQIVCRMAITDKLMWAAPAEASDDKVEMEEVTKVGRTPSFVTDTRLN
jgi:ribonuclease Z